MTARRRLNLPRLPELAALGETERPRLEQARASLGGRGATDGFAGTQVVITAAARTGVVLFADAREVDVWLEGSLVRRTARDLVAPTAEPDPSLDAVSADVKVFAALDEGDRVRWQSPDGAPGEGTLVEKCRYGALVACDDGRVLAMGFRRLWPALLTSD